MNIAITVGVVVMLIALIIGLYKWNKEYLKSLAYYIVVQMEKKYSSGNGKEKLKEAVAYVKGKLPIYISWLISEDAIISIIEKVLSTLQDTFKSTVIKQEAILETIMEKVKSGASINDIKIAATQMKQEVESKGYVEGYIEADTKKN